ncbi:DUF465 domain-containing protein [Yoonia sp. MH D7]
MADGYHVVNCTVHRAETDVAPTSDVHLVDMRRLRIALKEQINTYLNQHTE